MLDRHENATMPDAVLSEPFIDFGEVRNGEAVSRSVMLENVGQVAAEFRFIPKLDDKQFCKSWLWVNPPMGMTVPGTTLVKMPRLSIKRPLDCVQFPVPRREALHHVYDSY